MEEKTDKPAYVLVDDYFVDFTASEPVLQIPYHVQEVIYELALNYFINGCPSDGLEYCINFFNDLKTSKKVEIVEEITQQEEHEVQERRQSVYGESLEDLDDDDEDSEALLPKSESACNNLELNLRNILLFRQLDQTDIKKVIKHMFERQVLSGEVIIKEGDEGDYFYVVNSGEYQAYRERGGKMEVLHRYNNTGSFGELALMYNEPRAASVKALTDGSLWVLDRRTFQRIVLRSAFSKRANYLAFIEGMPMLKPLTHAEKVRLVDALWPKEYQPGEVIFQKDEHPDGLYFVYEGEVDLMVEDYTGARVVAHSFQRGDYFGEMSMVLKTPKMGETVAGPVSGAKLVFVEVDAFERLLGPCLDVIKRDAEIHSKELYDIFHCKRNANDLR